VVTAVLCGFAAAATTSSSDVNAMATLPAVSSTVSVCAVWQQYHCSNAAVYVYVR
jgi:hypothetical protein